MKNIIKHLSNIVLFCVIYFTSLSFIGAQDNLIISSKSGDFYYLQKKYTLYELEDILAKYPQSYYMFSNGERNRTRSVFYGVTGATSFGLGLLSFALIQKPDNLLEGLLYGGFNVVLYGAGTLFITSGTILGIVSLVKHLSGKSEMFKAISLFNAKESSNTSFNSEVKLGLSNHGIGFTLSF